MLVQEGRDLARLSEARDWRQGVKVVAALPWYDEQPSWLDRCVRSLAGVADYLVAIDGRWDLYDIESPVLSHWEQEIAISQAASAIRLECEVWKPGRVWPSQVAKRSELMRICSEKGDWIFVIDADEYVAKLDVDAWIEFLTLGTSYDVATVGFHALYEQMPDRRIRRLYRSGTEVRTAHNGYWLDGQWLHGDSAKVKLAPALDLSDVLVLHDDSGRRPAEREAKAMEYRRARARERVEVWP